MSISTTTNRVSYAGDGSTTVFPYNFLILANTDLEVIETVTATGVETIKTLTTHYTVSGAGTGSGNVTMVTAPASGTTLTIRRKMPRTQLVDYVENDSFPAATHEQALDKLTMIAQELDQTVKRSLRQPEGDSTDIDYLPPKVTRASMYLGFDADGDPVALGAPANTTAVSAYAATLLDDASASAARMTLDACQAINSMTAETVPASGDLLGMYDVSASAERKITLDNLLKFLHTSKVVEGRLTLESNVPISLTDQTGKTTLYFTPYGGNKIALYDGANWILQSFTQVSIAVPATTNTIYDVFAYDNAGTVTLELTAWTDDTTRATGLVYQDGVLAKNGATTHRYLGTIRTTDVSGQTEDSAAKRYVWNYYNRVPRQMRAVDTTDSWTYTTNNFRQANGNAANQLDFVLGVAEDIVSATAYSVWSQSNNGVLVSIGIGVDSTSVNSATVWGMGAVEVTSAMKGFISAQYNGNLAPGRHFLAWLESSVAIGTTTWYGDNGGGGVQSGITGILWG